MDQQTAIDSSRLHFHALVHLFTRVLQRSHLRGAKQEGEREKKCVWSRAEPYSSETKAHSDPWNTMEPTPSAPLGQAANNTHNAACLLLPESPVAILAQLAGDWARDLMPGSSLSCQFREATSWHTPPIILMLSFSLLGGERRFLRRELAEPVCALQV